MSKKFNKFETLCEKAYSHHANGGFRTNTPVRLRPEFFKSDYYETHYQKNSPFDQWLRGLIKDNPNIFFFIHDISSPSTNASSKDANDLSGSYVTMLTLSPDPRTVNSPTEFNDFSVPGDFKLVEVLDFGVNLPPVQGVPNKYEKYSDYVKIKPEPVDVDQFRVLNNHPTNNKLSTKNSSMPSSPVKDKRYFTGPNKSKRK